MGSTHGSVGLKLAMAVSGSDQFPQDYGKFARPSNNGAPVENWTAAEFDFNNRVRGQSNLGRSWDGSVAVMVGYCFKLINRGEKD